MIANNALDEPSTALISRAALTSLEPSSAVEDFRYQAIVSGAQVRSRVLIASQGSLRRVDAWTSATGMVLHAFAEDPDKSTGATLAVGALSVLALARMVGIEAAPGRSPAASSDHPVFSNADEFLAAAVRDEITASSDAAVRALVIGIRESGSDQVSTVSILHAGSTTWCAHDAAGPVELKARNFVGLWSALAPILTPIAGPSRV